MVKVTPFDTAEYLDNPRVIKYYLAEALKTGDENLIRRAKQNVRRAATHAKVSDRVVRRKDAAHASPKFVVRDHTGQVMARKAAKAAPAVKRAKKFAATKKR